MTYEEVKDLLKSVRSKKARLLSLQEYINEARQLAAGVSAVRYDSVIVNHSQENGPEKRITAYIVRIEKWEAQYDRLFEEMCAEEDKLAKMMQKLTPKEYEVILNRYLKGLSVRKTAKLMLYEEQTIKNISHAAIKKMAKI